MSTYGWDASNWDDPPRIRDGIDLYTHKAAEGHHFYYDREYRASLEAARGLGIPVLGAYFVNHSGSVADQVDWFVQLLDQDTPWWRTHPCFVLQIDAEQFSYMDRAPSPAEVQAFGDRLVQVHGVDPRRVLAYAPEWLYGGSLVGLRYRLWASNYGANPTTGYRQAYPGDASARWHAYSGQTPLILQYGSNCTIGDQTTCDANAYRGTLAELLATLGAGAPGGSPAPPPTVEDEMYLLHTPGGSIGLVDGYNGVTHQPYLYWQTDLARVQEWIAAGVSFRQIGHELTGAYWDFDGPEPQPVVIDDATLAKLLAGTAAAAREGAEAGAPTHEELVAAANEAEDS